MKPIKVALLGIGTVGSGVFKVLQRNQAEIKARTGRGIEITLVADRAADHARSIVGNTTEVITDAFAAVTRPEIDIVVELIGGYTVAKELVLKAIIAPTAASGPLIHESSSIPLRPGSCPAQPELDRSRQNAAHLTTGHFQSHYRT